MAPHAGPYTVANAMEAYLRSYERRGAKALYHTRRVAETHILPVFGSLAIARLTAKKIEDWHHGLAEKPPLARTKAGFQPNHRRVDKTTDGIRKRRSTANRILTVLKAALNQAWAAGHAPTDDAWRRVKPFKSVDTARVRYLSQEETERLSMPANRLSGTSSAAPCLLAAATRNLRHCRRRTSIRMQVSLRCARARPGSRVMSCSRMKGSSFSLH